MTGLSDKSHPNYTAFLCNITTALARCGIATAAVVLLAQSAAGQDAVQPVGQDDAPVLTATTFLDPLPAERPRFRWWIPRGGADEALLAAEIHAMRAAGAGGAEISPFFDPGGAQQTGAGLASTGWESKRWKGLVGRIYREAAATGFLIDNTLSGLGSDAISVPTPGGLNAPANSKTFVAGYKVLQQGAPFDGALPGTDDITTATALCRSVQPGDIRLHPVLANWLAPGDELRLGEGNNAETVRVAKVIAGTWGCGRLSEAVVRGQTTLTVSALAGGAGFDPVTARFTQFNPGQKIRVGNGPAQEVVTVESIGVGPPARFPYGAPEGTPADPDAPVTFRISALSKDHAIGAEVVVDGDEQSGIEVQTALVHAHGIAAPLVARGQKTLVAALAYRCSPPCDEQIKHLDERSVVDLTQDAADGRIDDLSWRKEGIWVLYVHQMVNDGPYQKGAFSPVGVDYPVDHLSAAGAKAVMDYWSNVLETPEVRAAIKASRPARLHLFEDSLEMPFTPKWTGDFVSRWKALRGYDPTPYLPTLFGIDQQARDINKSLFAPAVPVGSFAFLGVDAERVREDYRQTWSDLFRDRFVAPLTAWSEQKGMGTRFQVYGSFPIDTSWASSAVTVPEGEGLGFNYDINTYSIVASGAHMSGRRTISNECCAEADAAYRTRLVGPNSALAKVLASYAGGINQVVWHGFDHAQSRVSSWPGYHAWSALGGTSAFSEAFGPRQPFWGTGAMREVNTALGRLSLVLRQGNPRYDLAVLAQDFGRGLFAGPDAPGITSSGPLAQAGFTTEFLSPDFLVSGGSAAWDGHRLFAAKSAYSALIIDNLTSLKLQAAQTIARAAANGMPVVVIGPPPARSLGLDASGTADQAVVGAMNSLKLIAKERRSVAFVSTEEEAQAALLRLGIEPAAWKDAPDPVLSVRRETGDTSFTYLFNPSDQPVHGAWRLRGEGKPFLLDIWTGRTSALASWTQDKGRIRVGAVVPPNSALVLAISPHDLMGQRGFAPGWRMEEPKGSDAQLLVQSGQLVLRTFGPGTYQLRDQAGHMFDYKRLQPTMTHKFERWNVRITAWEDAGASSRHLTKRITRYNGWINSVGGLPSWKSLKADLANAAGVGTYSADLTLAGSQWARSRGALLSLGEVRGAATVIVNGRRIAYDPQAPQIDIGFALKNGRNRVVVLVASPLGNAVYPGEASDYGLEGPVEIKQYEDVAIQNDATFSRSGARDVLTTSRTSHGRSRTSQNRKAANPGARIPQGSIVRRGT